MRIAFLPAAVSTTLCVVAVCAQSLTVGSGVSAGTMGLGMVSSGAGELSIPQGTVKRRTVPDDTLVTLNVEAVPLQSGQLGLVSGFETAAKQVFGANVHIVDDRDKHWQLVVRDAKTGEAIDGLGWGSTGKPVEYSKTLNSDYTGGETYIDARFNASRPAINPQTGKEFEPKVMTYGESKVALENAKSTIAIYTPYNDTDWKGAIKGENGFYNAKKVVDNEAMMEWIAKNCQQWARDEFSRIDKPTLKEWQSERTAIVDTKNNIINVNSINESLPEAESTESGILNKEALHSLADLLETGEDIVEVRENMREDRRERKAKEKAERERKAAEEAERLRQQQLQEQRRKDNEKKPVKNSDKQTDKKPTPTPAQSSTPSVSIDFSKLNSLISQQVSFLRSLLASGQKATSAQHAQFNSLNSQYANEFNRLKAQIDALPDSSLRSQYYNQLASINSRMNSEVDPLLAQGESAGLFTNL